MPAIITIRALARDVEVKAFDATTGVEVEGYGGIVDRGAQREFHVDSAVDLRIHQVPDQGDTAREGYPAKAEEPSALPAIVYMGERRNWVFVESGEALTPADVDKYVKNGVIRTS
jgi:hypothetical protein